MSKSRRQVIIHFDASAPGGAAIVRNALKAIDNDMPFELPLNWKIVGVRGAAHSANKAKALHLEYMGEVDEHTIQGRDPAPPSLHGWEDILLS